MNSGSGCVAFESVEFNLRCGAKIRSIKPSSGRPPVGSCADRNPAILNLVLRLCFEVAGAMTFVQLI